MQPILATPITVIINQTLNTGIFPDKLKIAKIKPLYKKGDTSNLNLNYRPILLLPSKSKIFEKVIYQQHTLFVKKNFYILEKVILLLYAASELADRIIQEMDENKTPINIYLDLSIAFDSILS